jgi:hypothetical protein
MISSFNISDMHFLCPACILLVPAFYTSSFLQMLTCTKRITPAGNGAKLAIPNIIWAQENTTLKTKQQERGCSWRLLKHACLQKVCLLAWRHIITLSDIILCKTRNEASISRHANKSNRRKKHQAWLMKWLIRTPHRRTCGKKVKLSL